MSFPKNHSTKIGFVKALGPTHPIYLLSIGESAIGPSSPLIADFVLASAARARIHEVKALASSLEDKQDKQDTQGYLMPAREDVTPNREALIITYYV